MNSADAVEATGTRTGVLTPLANASLISGTVRVDHALWATIWRSADVINRTRARGRTIDVATLRVGTAG